jgi:hypothetical protein
MQKEDKNIKVFYPFLDHYWKFASFATVVLIMWVVMNLSFDFTKNTSYWNKTLEDPFFLLLSGLILFSILAGSINLYKGKTISISDAYISLRSRWREKTFYSEEIEYIKRGKERLFYFNQGLPVIKIKLKGKKGHLRIMPDRYTGDIELIKSIINLKK